MVFRCWFSQGRWRGREPRIRTPIDTAKPPRKSGWPQSVPAPPRSGSSCSTSLIVTTVWRCMPGDAILPPINPRLFADTGKERLSVMLDDVAVGGLDRRVY